MTEDFKQERTYWSKEVADLLGIGSSTLRKWCIQLEERGYKFLRDAQERRAFTERDVMALRSFRELTRDKGVTLENAADVVISRFNPITTEDRTPSVLDELPRSGERYEALMQKVDYLTEHTQKQEAFNQSLLELLKEQQAYIKNSIKSRDERLMTAIHELQEQRKMIAAAEEEKMKSKKKKWWQLRS
jgi:transposase-like protein